MKNYVTRFTLKQRIEHASVMTLFLVLALTGLPQKFFEASWAQAIIGGLGGIDRVRWVHRAAGVLFTLFTFTHLGVISALVVTGRATLSLVPTRQDFLDAIQQLRYYFGMTRRAGEVRQVRLQAEVRVLGPRAGRRHRHLTGLVLLFPIEATRFLPGEIVPASKLAHGNEGLMAFLVVIVWHIYNAHLNPDVFPFDTTIFTGKISAKRLHHEHELEYERLKETE